MLLGRSRIFILLQVTFPHTDAQRDDMQGVYLSESLDYDSTWPSVLHWINRARASQF